jgi:hypothetical protein
MFGYIIVHQQVFFVHAVNILDTKLQAALSLTEKCIISFSIPRQTHV